LRVRTTLRVAGRNDADAIADAWYAMMEEAALLHKTIAPRWREAFIAQLVDGIEKGAQYWLVAAREGSIVGTGGAIVRTVDHAITPPHATIVGMYVWPQYRRRGIAREILAGLIRFCRAREFCEVRLQATASGRPLYASVGFVAGDEMVLRF
jgi:GNAT superfamily N-acetyltransferase